MKTLRAFGLAITLTALSATSHRAILAQEFADGPAEPSVPADDSWYRSPAMKKENSTVAREKSIARGQQRMARLEAMRWYGFQGARPTASAMPYTTMYSPAWQQPGGRPFAWYTSSRPITIYHMSPLYK